MEGVGASSELVRRSGRPDAVSGADRRCSARPAIGHWADGVGKTKLLQDGGFEFPDVI
jgi:hypothetical protein